MMVSSAGNSFDWDKNSKHEYNSKYSAIYFKTIVSITNCGAYENGKCHSFRAWIRYKEHSHSFH